MAGFKRLLVANRGEIAVRILRAARELSLVGVAVYAGGDTAHAAHADEAVELASAGAFMDVEALVAVCREQRIDGVHPGYGFLSESADFAAALAAAGIAFVGPDASVLRATGDKLSARRLARDCGVPVLPALAEPTADPADVVRFAQGGSSSGDSNSGGGCVGWPVMLKAVDGGGGRGIRLVRSEDELRAAFARAKAESPSGRIFAERALVDDARHVEVQIFGDGHSVTHYWERECSVQRRQPMLTKVDGLLPPLQISESGRACSINATDRLAAKIIASAVKLAERVRYRSLGTFEFLASPSTGEYYFMEINPRLQVEHTITEAIAGVDLVDLQLRLAAGMDGASVHTRRPADQLPPPLASIQLRVTAEDPRQNFSLSIGKVKEARMPGGNGVRVDTHVKRGTVVSPDYDSLLAKIIVTAGGHQAATAKGLRALSDLYIDGVTTNRDLLAGILLSESFQNAQCDTHWLEKSIKPAIDAGSKWLRGQKRPEIEAEAQTGTSNSSSGGGGGSGLMIRKGDRWNVAFGPKKGSTNSGNRDDGEQVTIKKISRNDLPHAFAAEVAREDGSVFDVRLSQAEGEASASLAAGSGPNADPRNPHHLACPMSGQLVEMLVDEGDEVREEDGVAVVRQMKMELEVRAHRAGVVSCIWPLDDGDMVSQGMLVCEIRPADDPPKGKL